MFDYSFAPTREETKVALYVCCVQERSRVRWEWGWGSGSGIGVIFGFGQRKGTREFGKTWTSSTEGIRGVSIINTFIVSKNTRKPHTVVARTVSLI